MMYQIMYENSRVHWTLSREFTVLLCLWLCELWMIYFFSVLAMAILSYRRTNLLEVTNLQAAQVCMLQKVILPSKLLSQSGTYFVSY